MNDDIGPNEAAASGGDDLRLLLVNAARSGNDRLLADLCAEHGDEIARQAAEWARVPGWARENDVVLSQWVNAMQAIAQKLDALGHPELLNRIAGRGRDNPAVRLYHTLAQAQQLAAVGEVDASTTMLRDLLAEMEKVDGPFIHFLRSRAFGTLAENALQAKDYASSRDYTTRALAAAKEARDGDGVRTFGENLDTIVAIEAFVRDGDFGSELLRCRERIARAQRLSDETRYDLSNRILRDVNAELEARPDGESARYRAKVWGLLGLNCFRLRDVPQARRYTERALAECTRAGDADGIRIYRLNLEIIADSIVT